MEDPNLNRNLEEIKELQTRWNQFHDFVNMAMQQGPSKITAQAEMKFLELKSRIAMLHDGFMGGVKSDVKTAQNIIQIVADCILLKKMSLSTEAEKQKFEFDWNECFMLLTETVSTMEEEKKRLAGINERAYRAAQMRDLWRARIHNFLHSALLKWSVITFGTIGALISVEVFYGYTNIYLNFPFTRGVYVPTASIFRRFINQEYVYADYSEVEAQANNNANRVDSKDKGNPIKEDAFKKNELVRMGFNDGLDEAKKLLDGRKDKTFWMLQLDEAGLNNFYAFVLNTSADAKKFCDLWRTDLNKKSDQKQAILDKTLVLRKANLVVIGYGPHPLHGGFIQERFNPFTPVVNQIQ